MKAVIPLVGCALFVYCCASFVGDFGTRWECGRYYMPRTLVAADGHSYPDGKPIPAATLILARSGIEEDVMLGMVTVLGVLLVYLAVEIRSLNRTAREYSKLFGRDFKRS